MCQMDISIQYDDVFINIMNALKIILNHKTILLLKKNYLSTDRTNRYTIYYNNIRYVGLPATLRRVRSQA